MPLDLLAGYSIVEDESHYAPRAVRSPFARALAHGLDHWATRGAMSSLSAGRSLVYCGTERGGMDRASLLAVLGRPFHERWSEEFSFSIGIRGARRSVQLPTWSGDTVHVFDPDLLTRRSQDDERT